MIGLYGWACAYAVFVAALVLMVASFLTVDRAASSRRAQGATVLLATIVVALVVAEVSR